jgi:hypothetical protein
MFDGILTEEEWVILNLNTFLCLFERLYGEEAVTFSLN